MNIVIVFPKKEIAMKINNILTNNGYHVAAICASGAKALVAVQRLEEGIIVSGVRYVDMMYQDLKDELTDDFEMILVATHSQWDYYGEDGVTFLPVPFKAYELIDLVEDFSWKLEKKKKRRKIKSKVRSSEEEKKILQAKERLMSYHDWSEEQAHRYLQKNSMDTGRSLVDTAECVLEMFHIQKILRMIYTFAEELFCNKGNKDEIYKDAWNWK